ncbi:MAG: hypothetical protein AAFY28_08155 [Actinomycetota bacterium]
MGKQLELRIGVGSLLWLFTAAGLGVAATLIVVSAWNANAAPGDTDATYNPTAGCRVADTRGPNNIGPRATALGEGEVLAVAIHGDNGECVGNLAVPPDATGVALNVTAVGATTASNIRLYPGDLAEVPLLSNLNVTAGAPPTPNKVDVQLAPDGTIKVFNFRGSVHIVIDVVGFYTPASLKELAATTGQPGPAGPPGPPGPNAMSIQRTHGFGPTIPNAVNPATVERFRDRVRVSAQNGTTQRVEADLDGPRSADGIFYGLRTIRMCVNANIANYIDRVEVWAQGGTNSAELIGANDADVTDSRCHAVFLPDVGARRSYSVSVWITRSGIDLVNAVDFVSLESTWSQTS